MPAEKVDGTDFFAVYEAVGRAVARARRGEGPSAVEAVALRYYGHFEGDMQRYRAKDEVAKHRATKDPLDRMIRRLTTDFDIAPADLEAIDREILDLLDERGLPRAIATSSSHNSVLSHLRAGDILHRFGAVIARGDYARGKPYPDPFLKAAEAIGVAPGDCLALEDSHNGVRAAHAAGMMTVMVPDLLEPTEEMRALCVHIAESLHHVCDLITAGGAEPRP